MAKHIVFLDASDIQRALFHVQFEASRIDAKYDCIASTAVLFHLVKHIKIDVVVVDLRIVGLDLAQLSRTIKGYSPNTEIIFYADVPDSDLFELAMRYGRIYSKNEASKLFAFLKTLLT